jgi:hypothetical protein
LHAQTFSHTTAKSTASYYYRISVDEFEVTSGTNKYTGDIVIPETVEYEGAKVDKSVQRLTDEREGKEQGSDLI